MKEVLMSNREYEEYKKWKEHQEKYDDMKNKGELFYIDIKPFKGINISDSAHKEPWGGFKIWG